MALGATRAAMLGARVLTVPERVAATLGAWCRRPSPDFVADRPRRAPTGMVFRDSATRLA
jgi:hypothetical protein